MSEISHYFSNYFTRNFQVLAFSENHTISHYFYNKKSYLEKVPQNSKIEILRRKEEATNLPWFQVFSTEDEELLFWENFCEIVGFSWEFLKLKIMGNKQNFDDFSG